ncbi:MAG: hypothetical protein HY790_01700 [Deltaproteobacteria bacterium]|nr:hypothetical protein [Deltaproteobacteria bacterium]MBI4794552.1 hypothetical protein [Deltaproteobacteria bacterium]
MLPKSPQPELSHTCTHPHCCGQEAAGGETVAGNPPGALAERPDTKLKGLWSFLKHYALWFLAFFGIYASSSVCPCCGTPGCPVGVSGAALVGGVFACLWQYGRNVWERWGRFLTKVCRSRREVPHVAGEDKQL